ncbi:hypothetical protein PG984_008157 [Apiospora sp. TS-2023a]
MATENQETVPPSVTPVDGGIWMTKDEVKDYLIRHMASLREGELQQIGIRRQGSLYQIWSHKFGTVDSTQLEASDSAPVGSS